NDSGWPGCGGSAASVLSGPLSPALSRWGRGGVVLAVLMWANVRLAQVAADQRLWRRLGPLPRPLSRRERGPGNCDADAGKRTGSRMSRRICSVSPSRHPCESVGTVTPSPLAGEGWGEGAVADKPSELRWSAAAFCA